MIRSVSPSLVSLYTQKDRDKSQHSLLPCHVRTEQDIGKSIKRCHPPTHTLNLSATQPWTLSHTRFVINAYCVIHISLGQMLSMTFCSNHPKCLLKQHMRQSLQLRNRQYQLQRPLSQTALPIYDTQEVTLNTASLQ